MNRTTLLSVCVFILLLAAGYYTLQTKSVPLPLAIPLPETAVPQVVSQSAATSSEAQSVLPLLPEIVAPMSVKTEDAPVPRPTSTVQPGETLKQAAKPVVQPTPEPKPTPAPTSVRAFAIKEITKTLQRETDYAGQEQKSLNLNIVFAYPTLIQEGEEWKMDVSLDMTTRDARGGATSFFHGSDLQHLTFSSPYKLTTGTFVMNAKTPVMTDGVYESVILVRDNHAGASATQTVSFDLNF